MCLLAASHLLASLISKWFLERLQYLRGEPNSIKWEMGLRHVVKISVCTEQQSQTMTLLSYTGYRSPLHNQAAQDTDRKSLLVIPVGKDQEVVTLSELKLTEL